MVRRNGQSEENVIHAEKNAVKKAPFEHRSRIIRREGAREVAREIEHYNLNIFSEFHSTCGRLGRRRFGNEVEHQFAVCRTRLGELEIVPRTVGQ